VVAAEEVMAAVAGIVIELHKWMAPRAEFWPFLLRKVSEFELDLDWVLYRRHSIDWRFHPDHGGSVDVLPD
jgi:hypothetical protein